MKQHKQDKPPKIDCIPNSTNTIEMITKGFVENFNCKILLSSFVFSENSGKTTLINHQYNSVLFMIYLSLIRS